MLKSFLLRSTHLLPSPSGVGPVAANGIAEPTSPTPTPPLKGRGFVWVRIRSRRRLAIGAGALATIVAACLLTNTLRAEPGDETPDPADGGALMLTGKGAAQALPAVRLGTDMDVTVSGPIARVRVTQAFRNSGDKWMEATYLYPLPDDGAVDTLKMVVGQHVFVGHIKRRAEARAIYDKARAEGRKTGLVESERPNLFRNTVANVGPHETVLISIEYQAPVRQLGGEYALRLPLVVGPRYVPPHTVTSQAAADDAHAVTAPLADPSLGKSLNPVSITVHLAPGFAPANVISPYHKINVADAGPMARTVTLAQGEVPADRDFELRWRSAGGDPTLALFRQSLNGQQYVMAAITPPAMQKIAKAPPREMVFVVDNSGSMGGGSIEAARESLDHALDTLRPEDTFNVIRFDDTMTQLFDHSVPATPDQIVVAKKFSDSLEAAGGTEMLPALKAALVDPGTGPAVRQVIFLTDGDLSNEREMMAEIAAHGGKSRLFMIGVGSAPNAYLMHRLAEAGRGTYTNIADRAEVNAKMDALLERLRMPAVQDLSVKVDGAPLELTPQRLPDLYAGEPLTLLGKGENLSGKLTVSGTIGDKPWSESVDLATAQDSPAVARLWANRRIADVEAQRASGQMEDDAANEAVAKLGLDYSLVTSQTSLVAEDETPSRPAGARLTKEELPLLLPAGWDFDTLFGLQGAAGDMSKGDAGPADQGQAMDLPQTATGFMGMIERGLGILALGLAGLVALGRRPARQRRAISEVFHRRQRRWWPETAA